MYKFFLSDPFLLKVFLFFQGIYLDIYELIKGINVFDVILCFTISVVAIFFADRYFTKRASITFVIISAFYFTFLISITILGREPILKSSWDGLFNTYIEALNENKGMQFDILFNVFLYIPIGLLISRYKNNLVDVMIILSLSTVIEFVQLITSRGVFEISDIINNFIGGLIGLGFARLIGMIIKQINDKRKGGQVERAE